MAEALRLAYELDQYLYSVPAHPLCTAAAAELRRLHAENEALRNVANRGGHIAVAMSRIDQLEAQRDALLAALKMLVLATKEVSVGRYNEEAHDIALSKARAAIKAAEEAK